LPPGDGRPFAFDRCGAQRSAGGELRFLLVASDTVLARSLRTCLAAFGEVIVAGTLREALRTCRKVVDWSAFVLDAGLPDGSGVRMLEELRGPCSDVPALIITGYAEPECINAAYRLGARCLVKPVLTSDVERFVRSIPLKSRLESAAGRWAVRYALSPAETDVLVGAALGEDRATIARRRESTLATVKSHVAKLLEKTGDAGLLDAANRLLRDLHTLNG
jgi:DNA-binding NarL/FixJ family response regulator